MGAGVPEGFAEVTLGLGEGRGHVSVLTRDEDARSDDWVDPNFFEPGYSVAGSTGFRVWEGTRVAADLLLPRSQRAYTYILGEDGGGGAAGAGGGGHRLEEVLEGIRGSLEGKRVLELGSGTGLAALVLARAAAAHVLATDLRAVVDDVLWVNVEREAEKSEVVGSSSEEVESFSHRCFPGGVSIGSGSVSCYPLDWVTVEDGADWRGVTSLARPRLSLDPLGEKCDVVLGVECVWLAELVPSFVATVREALRRGASGGHAVLIGRERATEASRVFCSMGDVAKAFQDQGLQVHEIVKTKARDQDPSGDGFVAIYTVRVP